MMRKIIHGILLTVSILYAGFFTMVAILSMFGECGAFDSLIFIILLLICIGYLVSFAIANKDVI